MKPLPLIVKALPTEHVDGDKEVIWGLVEPQSGIRIDKQNSVNAEHLSNLPIICFTFRMGLAQPNTLWSMLNI